MNSSFLLKLLETNGISGSEDVVAALIEQEIRPFVDKVFRDKMGNLIAVKHGKGPKLMLAAHMDEVGLMVKNVDGEGLLRLAEVGGLNLPSLVGQRVMVLGKKPVAGIVSTKIISNDWTFDVEKPVLLRHLFVDTGLSKKELVKRGIGVGSPIALLQFNGFLSDPKLVYGKALDDRIGCFVLCEVARRLKKSAFELLFVFTVQEEVGLYGSKVSAYHLNPDYSVVIDTCNANDRENDAPTKVLGKGPILTIMDVEMIGNRHLNERIQFLAKKNRIPLQPEVSSQGTTDALSIAFSKEGIPTSMVGVAIRNAHTTVGIAHLADIEHCIKLLLLLVKKKF